jgi:fatty acid desaturase
MWSARCGNCWVGMAERRKLIASMLVLTIFGALLLVPPLVYVFNQPITHFGVPQVVIYLFVVWLLLIMGTAMLTHLLPPETGDTTNGPEAD